MFLQLLESPSKSGRFNLMNYGDTLVEVRGRLPLIDQDVIPRLDPDVTLAEQGKAGSQAVKAQFSGLFAHLAGIECAHANKGMRCEDWRPCFVGISDEGKECLADTSQETEA